MLKTFARNIGEAFQRYSRIYGEQWQSVFRLRVQPFQNMLSVPEQKIICGHFQQASDVSRCSKNAAFLLSAFGQTLKQRKPVEKSVRSPVWNSNCVISIPSAGALSELVVSLNRSCAKPQI
jgi:hypothetical protein